MDGHEFEQTLGDSEGPGRLSDKTQQLSDITVSLAFTTDRKERVSIQAQIAGAC